MLLFFPTRRDANQSGLLKQQSVVPPLSHGVTHVYTCLHMFSRNSMHPLSRDGALSGHINGGHDHVSRYKSYYQKDKLC